jgi:hypothetical protein
VNNNRIKTHNAQFAAGQESYQQGFNKYSDLVNLFRVFTSNPSLFHVDTCRVSKTQRRQSAFSFFDERTAEKNINYNYHQKTINNNERSNNNNESNNNNTNNNHSGTAGRG